MNNKVFDILVNFEANDSLTSNPIRIVQGDYNSIDFVFQFSITYDLALFYLVRPDGTVYVTALNQNRLTVNAEDDVFNQPGKYEFGVSCYDEDSRLTLSQKGKIKVVTGLEVDAEEIESSDNYHILDDLINQVTSLIPTYNANHAEKMAEYNANHTEKMNEYDSNASAKLEGFNSNALQFEEDAETVSGFTFSQWGNSKRLEEHMRNHIALTPDYNTYGVDFPLWETSQSSAGVKTDDNVNYSCTPGTDTVKTIDTYPESWKTFDVNAVVDSNGVRHLTGVKGLNSYRDKGEVDCYVLKRTYWQKIWTEDGYLKIRRRFVPTEGYDICPLAINKDGSWNPFFYKPKYFAGEINGKLYGSKDLLPAHQLNMNASENPSEEEYSENISYSGIINLARAKGSNYYSAGLLAEWYDTLTTFYLKFATRNTQSIMKGNTSNDKQAIVTQVTTNSNRVVISTANANAIDLYSCVSVGDPGSATNRDRQHSYMHNIVYDARVIGKEVVDANNTALILDHEEFTTTATSYVSTMHERSGFSDLVLGRTGSPISNTNGKHGFVFDGEELAVGGYEVLGNAFMDIVNANGDREIYWTNDASEITATVATAKANYKHSDIVVRNATLAGNYITEMGFDAKNGLAVPTNAGQSGASDSTGYADRLYFDTATSGQREFLLLGHLANGTTAGLSCLFAYYGLSSANWYILARLSINGVGGELSE